MFPGRIARGGTHILAEDSVRSIVRRKLAPTQRSAIYYIGSYGVWKLQCFCHGFRRKTRSTFSIGVWFATNKSVDPASAITHAIKTQKNSGRPHVVHGGLAQFTCLRCVCDIICTQLKQLPNRRRTRNGQELNPYRGREAKAARNGLPYSYR